MKVKSFQEYNDVLEQLDEYDKSNKSSINFSKDIESMKAKLNSQEFSIAVIANMSSGKSTFINALFGDDVLPAFNEATTDCATYIHSDNDDNNNQAIIHFDDDKKSVTIKSNDVKREIKYYAKKDNDELDDKYRNVSKIDLSWDFKHLNTEINNKIKVTFIDTPGPNNTGDFAEKHKDQTAELINRVDMVLFLFDYMQLDANLSSDDEQGIWNKLKLRKKFDEDFGVYFIVNKIDASIEDLVKLTKDLPKEERKEKRQKDWNKEKEKSILRISDAATKHGFDNPDIYTVSSQWALLNRKDRDEEEDDDLDDIKKKKIKRIWDKQYEDKFNDFLGFETLEDAINLFINNQIEKKVLKSIHEMIENSIQEKIKNLDREKEISSQGVEEAKKNLQNAKDVLKNEAPEIFNNFEQIANKKKDSLLNEITNVLENVSTVIFSEKEQEKLIKQSIYYLKGITDGKAEYTANKQASNEDKKYYEDIILEKQNIFKNNTKYDKDELFEKMNEYTSIKLNDLYRDFELSSKSRLREVYKLFSKDLNSEYKSIKDELSQKIDKALKIKLPIVNSKLYKIDIQTEQLDTQLEKTAIHSETDYGFWGLRRIPEFFGSDIDEEIILINGNKLFSDMNKNISKRMDEISRQEENSHKNNIERFVEQYFDLFRDFKDKKTIEIEELEENYEEARKSDFANKDAHTKLEEILGKLNG